MINEDTARLGWIEQLLMIFWDGDDVDSLFWRPTNGGVFVRQEGLPPAGPVSFAAMCSDTFMWGCADCEDIELPGDLKSLQQALDDSRAVEKANLNEEGKQVCFVDWVTLWCCRKRGMRPMNAWLKRDRLHPAERALFEAAGPPRESEFGAP